MTNATLKLEKEEYADKFGFKKKFDEYTSKQIHEKKRNKLNKFIKLFYYLRKIFIFIKNYFIYIKNKFKNNNLF